MQRHTGILHRIGVGVGSAVLTAGIVAAGAVALSASASAAPVGREAAGADPAKLVAIAEIDPATGRNKANEVRPGEIGKTLLGVANAGDAPVAGVVLWVRVLDDLAFLNKYANCVYTDDSNAHNAWCRFDQALAPNDTYQVAESFVGPVPNADPNKITAVVFRWYSLPWADGAGVRDGLIGAPATPGTGGTLALKATPLTLPTTRQAINFAYLKLAVPPSSSSSASTSGPASAGAAASGTTVSSGTPSSSAGPALAVTGSDTMTLVGIGGGLLLLGGVAFVIARRRRARFVA